jgi:hypothetical protein
MSKQHCSCAGPAEPSRPIRAPAQFTVAAPNGVKPPEIPHEQVCFQNSVVVKTFHESDQIQ